VGSAFLFRRLESFQGSLALPDRPGVALHLDGPFADEDGLDGSVVQDDAAGAAVAAEPEGCALVAVDAGGGDGFGQVAGAAVAGCLGEGGRWRARRSPAVLLDPVRDRVCVVAGLVVGVADARADRRGEPGQILVVAGGEFAPVGRGEDGGDRYGVRVDRGEQRGCGERGELGLAAVPATRRRRPSAPAEVTYATSNPATLSRAQPRTDRNIATAAMLHSRRVSRGSLHPNVVSLMAACIRTWQPSRVADKVHRPGFAS